MAEKSQGKDHVINGEFNPQDVNDILYSLMFEESYRKAHDKRIGDQKKYLEALEKSLPQQRARLEEISEKKAEGLSPAEREEIYSLHQAVNFYRRHKVNLNSLEEAKRRHEIYETAVKSNKKSEALRMQLGTRVHVIKGRLGVFKEALAGLALGAGLMLFPLYGANNRAEKNADNLKLTRLHMMRAASTLSPEEDHEKIGLKGKNKKSIDGIILGLAERYSVYNLPRFNRYEIRHRPSGKESQFYLEVESTPLKGKKLGESYEQTINDARLPLVRRLAGYFEQNSDGKWTKKDSKMLLRPEASMKLEYEGGARGDGVLRAYISDKEVKIMVLPEGSQKYLENLVTGK